MKTVAEIVIENASPTFDKIYSYLIPEKLKSKSIPGARVRIPFGRGNKKRTGLIISLKDTDNTDKLKEILEVLDSPPILNDEGLRLLRYLKLSTFCTWFDALRLLIPAGMGVKPKISYKLGDSQPRIFDQKSIEILNYLSKRKKGITEETLCKNLEIEPDNDSLNMLVETGHVVKIRELRQRILDDKVTMVDVIDDCDRNLTVRQMEVMDFLIPEAPVSLKEAMYYTSASRSVFDTLSKKGIIEYYEDIRSRGGFVHAEQDDSPLPELSDEQLEVYEGLKKHRQEDSPSPALLYGVTGSGKTQVFLKLAQDVVDDGRTVIVMVPEISLTSQTVISLQKQFGNKVAVLHSGLSLGERMDEWKRINDGLAPVVVGTRSAVFAPLSSIGLIVIDEEQEHTYKSDRSPRFHARDIALVRAKHHNALLLLSSATPAVESYHKAVTGTYKLFKLKERFGEAILPEVFKVDMSSTENMSMAPSLSNTLLEEIYYNLEHNEQSILLLNRRGYSTLVKCSSCGEPAQCPNCSIALTYHTANDSLVCHYCGYGQKRQSNCNVCGSEFVRYSGVGTQKLEEELKGIFPKAGILRMDLDTTMARDSHEQMFDAFSKQEYDILIGTQMVAKGLNFPNVTLVGVINADQALYADNFRSYERSFSLLTQVVGRSGRGDRPGRAYIQTYVPEHPIIELASNQDYPNFFKDEIMTRRLHLYPPFCTLAGFGFVGENLDDVRQAAYNFTAKFQKTARDDYPQLPMRVLGPSPGEILKIAGKYRYKLIVKCRADAETQKMFSEMLDWFYKKYRDVSIYIDMHYERM